MNTRLKIRTQAGFTLVELLVVAAIIEILVGIATVAPQINQAVVRLALHPRLAPLAQQIGDFTNAAESSTQAFRLSLADDALAANDPQTSEIHLDALKSFCNADSQLMDLRNQVNVLLAAEGGKGGDQLNQDGDEASADGRKALVEAGNALDAELPAVQKLANLLRTKGGDVCPPVLE